MFTNKKWPVFAALAVFAVILAACAPAAEPETVVETVVVESEGETIVETVVVEAPTEESVSAEDDATGEIPFEMSDAPYRVGVFSDITTTNFWGANGPDNTVWNSYVLPPRPTVLQLTELTFELAPLVAADFPEPLVEEGDFWVTEVTFRDDVTWSDGEAVTPEDWAFTAQVALDFGLIAGNWQQWYDANFLDRIEAVDDTTAKLYYHTKPGLARHEYGVLQSPILAAHFWEPLTADAYAELEGVERPGEDASEDEIAEFTVAQTAAQDILYAVQPEGEPTFGAWVFNTWEPGAFAENERNEDYFQAGTTVTYYADGGYEETQAEATVVSLGETSGDVDMEFGIGPFAGSAVYSIYGSQDAALLALRNGEIDFVLNPLGLQRGLLDQVEGDDTLTVLENPTNAFRYLSFNVRRAPMDNVAFRQAAATLIDKEFVTGTILQGVAFPLDTFVPEANEAWYFDDVPRWGFNDDGSPMSRQQRVEAAVQILSDAGFTWDGPEPVWDPDNNSVMQGTGTLVTPEGTPVPELELLAPSPGYDPLRSTFAIWVESWLQDVGVPVTANLTGFNVIVQKVFVEQDFDMQILGWSLGIFPDFLYDFFSAEQTVLDGNNAGGWINEEYEVLGQQLFTCEDQAECAEIANQMQLILSTELPYVVLFDTGIIEAYNSGNVRFPYDETLGGLQFGGHPVGDSVAIR